MFEQSDLSLLNYLRRSQSASVGDLVDLLGVTATAVRQRLNRLMADGLIERQLNRPEDQASRGRPSYRYRLTDLGLREAGNNYDDLVQAMWEEIRSIADPDVRVGLIKRLASKLADRYAGQVQGDDLVERMRALMQLMGEREVPIDVDESGELPVLTMLACPYPVLAEQDRSVCAMEKVMLTEVLGQGVKLSECRLDGDNCCSFQPSQQTAEATTN